MAATTTTRSRAGRLEWMSESKGIGCGGALCIMFLCGLVAQVCAPQPGSSVDLSAYDGDSGASARSLAAIERKRREMPEARLLEPRKPEPHPRAAESYKPSNIAAWVFAKELVSRRLKAPGTAEWPDDSWLSGVNIDDLVTYQGNRTYEVRAWVDAQNSFGALLRKDFVCRLRDDGESWALLSISGL